MACNEHEKIIAFDTLFSTNQTQMLKIILPFMDNQMQKHLAIYIKLLELRYTIDFLKKHPFQLCGCTKQESFSEFPKLCDELLPFCGDKEKKQLEQMRGIIHSMEMYREMSKTMEAMKDFMPDMGIFSSLYDSSPSSASPTAGLDLTNMLMNMMTPEQKEMYEMFKGDYSDAN